MDGTGRLLRFDRGVIVPWLEKRERWFPAVGGVRDRKPPVEKTYSVTEVMELLSVTRHTVFKWLMSDEDGAATIPAAGWFKLPSGHIRIRESALSGLMDRR